MLTKKELKEIEFYLESRLSAINDIMLYDDQLEREYSDEKSRIESLLLKIKNHSNYKA